MRYWEDFTVGMVMEFGGYEVTEEEVIEFATAFDPQPFHIDKDAAKEHFFGGIIASGWHTGSMCMKMMVDNYLIDSASMGSPGIEQLRWKQPVRPGEVLHVKAEVLDRSLPKSRPELGFVKFSHTVLNQKDEVKMTMISSGMFLRCPENSETEASR
ncbi:MaoC family dehydratase [Sneathiella sp. HT1-7]|jgi:acyl dehydratase|uniref:MaoC family dehydratase n=1 Tax=Sneathiella sp. HT1-7 TaxID=2887192 RepID=UPI001D15A745|nr:MaoC family dehydratase [Sneathiella sp. HT1-7]MCC3306676.1 MaoC family dehydratase [Sneathiella sp. HT1-7]